VASALLVVGLLAGATARAEGGLGLLMAGPTCPDAAVTAQLEGGLSRRSRPQLPHAQVAAALARARGERALTQARNLFRRTDFDGCIALLSITEQELGRNLADPDEALLRRAHQLLAQVNLWLGICQWAAGDPQTAAGSFVRAAQLPANPAPDPRLLPPELVEAHRAALSAPRQDVSCQIAAPLRPEHLLVDGRAPDLDGAAFRVAAGTHYVTLQPTCRGGDASFGAPRLPSSDCPSIAQQLGGSGRSLRLVASTMGCRVQVPSRLAASRITCASPSEVAEPEFVAALTVESRGEGTLTVSQAAQRLTLQLHRRGSTGFARQIVTELEAKEPAAQQVARGLGLLLGLEVETAPRRRGEAWYQRWWVWALVGSAVLAATTTGIAISRSHGSKSYRVVFQP
jgi:hypothetical protein